MPTRKRVKTRAPLERWLDLSEAGDRVGYAPQSLRMMMFRESRYPKPPLEKIRGRWMVKLTDLDEWARSQRIPLQPLRDEAAS